MATAIANSSVYDPGDFNLKKFLGYSVALHGSLALAIAISSFVHWNGEQWSGTGTLGNDAKVNLVSGAGLPMPQPKETTNSQTVDPTQTLNKPDPTPPPPEPKTDAERVPEFKHEKPLPPSHKSKTFDDKTPPDPNAIPGHGGPPKIQTGMGDTPGSSASGVNMNGQAGGDFASRYAWYIAAAKRRVDPNWDRLSIDAAVRNSAVLHCEVTFVIQHDGSIKDVHITKSSGNLSWDNSAIRAIAASSPFAPLPSDWRPPDVTVYWDFPDVPAH
jgi:TonB family protein